MKEEVPGVSKLRQDKHRNTKEEPQEEVTHFRTNVNLIVRVYTACLGCTASAQSSHNLVVELVYVDERDEY